MSGVVLVSGPAPALSGVHATGQFHAIAVSLKSNQTSVLAGTLYRRLPGGGFVFAARLGGTLRPGVTFHRVVHTKTAGRFKLVLRVRGGGLSAHTLFATAA